MTARTEPYAWVATAASVVFVAFSLFAREESAKYRYAFASLIPIVWIAFALRRQLGLSVIEFALFALGLVLHDLGAFGAYQRSVIGLQFDWLVHAYFGVVGGIILARIFEGTIRSPLAHALVVVLVVTGIGGLHEIVEAASTMFLGDMGMLYVGADNPFDTQEDMLCNVVGASVAVAVHRLRG